jgi:hypothetical protein
MKASKTAITQIIQFVTGILVLLGFGHDVAADMANQLGVQLETLVGLLIAIWAGVGGTMNKVRTGGMSGGLAGYLFKSEQ